MTDAAQPHDAWRPTIGQLFAVAALATALVVALGFAAAREYSRRAVLATSERSRDGAARRVEGEVAASLSRAEEALEAVERLVRSGAVSLRDPRALEVALFSALESAPHLAEVTLTAARFQGDGSAGEARLDAAGRFQISVYRDAADAVFTRHVRGEEGTFTSVRRRHSANGRFDEGTPSAPVPAADPTEHPTYSVAAAAPNRGRALWSDLHYSELDEERQGEVGRERRVVLSVQKAVRAEGGALAVLRVALLTTDLDAIAQAPARGPGDPHRVALLSSSSDGVARLVARMSAGDSVQAFGNELRVVPRDPPEWLAALLRSPLVKGLDPEHPGARGELTVGPERHLATLRELSRAGGGTAGWLVAIVVPESFYTGDLVRAGQAFIVVFVITLAVVLAIAGAALVAIRRGLADVVRTTARMRSFDFAPTGSRSRLREVDDVLVGLERAKTVARAMGRYVPLALVRRLYEKNQDPELGGETAELTMLFTDIEGFTSLSERLSPDALAARLGEYLEVVTSAVERTSGTIDKYIGDAVMAFWNAPTAVRDHALRSCEAVLECQRATAALYASPAWAGLPPLTTRYGVHSAEVLVGHFGAQSRLSYTALGDGVNLAARLEPLCKQYGVTVLVSEAVEAAARGAYVFRRIDRVAVKGKTQGIEVYELIGRTGEVSVPEYVPGYERAFEAYLAMDFAGAEAILEQQDHDAPSRVLLERCRRYRHAPPAPGWNGVHVASSK